jgi:hypothetical protein
VPLLSYLVAKRVEKLQGSYISPQFLRLSPIVASNFSALTYLILGMPAFPLGIFQVKKKIASTRPKNDLFSQRVVN